MLEDVHLALRQMGKSRIATVLSVLSIALGIGLTTGIFRVADAMLLRPFPIERPGEVFSAASRSDEGRSMLYGWPDVEDMTHVEMNLAGYERRATMLGSGEEYQLALIVAATPNYFSLLGVNTLLGQASFDAANGRPAAVLGYRLWRRVFDGDLQIVGKTVLLNQNAFFVAGVMPAEFTGLERGTATDIWISTESWFEVLRNWSERQNRTGQFEIVARLKPGADPQRVAAQLDAAIRGPGKHKPAPVGMPGTVLEARFALRWTDSLILGGGLLLVLGLVLFVACANVAQLRLAQAETRKKELAVRMALGAGAQRMMRQFLLETGLVVLPGAALGVLLGQALIKNVSEFLSAGAGYTDYGIRLDHRVLTFTFAAVVFSVLLAGLVPARRVLRENLAEVLKSEQRAFVSRIGRQKKTLIVGQIAVSVTLFGTAVLFLQSMLSVMAVWPGFDPDKKLLVMTVSPGSAAQIALWCEEACERLSGLPGVRGATFARRLPLSGSGGGATVAVEIPGQEPLGVHFNNVAGNYFSVMGTRVLAGRGINTKDREASPLVVVVSQTFARQVFGNRNPLGEWISVDAKLRQIVGVAENGASNDLHEGPEPFLYLPFTQAPSGDITLIIETAGESGALAKAAREELKRFDSRVVMYSSTTLRENMDRALSHDRMMATLATTLGIIGILLTAAGLFGVQQHAVNRRTAEIGVRLALGAQPRAIRRMVLAESLRMAAWGIPIGLVMLATTAWYVRSQVLGVTPLNPLMYLSSTVVAVAVVLLAGWIPAHRAAFADPLSALRYDKGNSWSAVLIRRPPQAIHRTRGSTAEDGTVFLTDLSQAARSVTSFSQFLESVAEKIRQHLGSECVSILIHNDHSGQFVCAASSPMAGSDGRLSIEKDAFVVRRLQRLSTLLQVNERDFHAWEKTPALEEGTERNARRHEAEVLRRLRARILLKITMKDELVGILAVGPRGNHAAYLEGDQGLLTAVASQLAFVIESARLLQRISEHELLERELTLAAEVQRRLLPEHPPRSAYIELAGFCQPCRVVGGDYYDFLELEGGRIAVVLADVAGKGISAALLVSIIQASLRSLVPLIGETPSELIFRLNRLLHRCTGPSSYATLFYAEYDPQTALLSYVNAGHNPPFLARIGNGCEPSSLPLITGGTIVGMFSDSSYEQGTLPLQSGDTLMVYSDGVTEAVNHEGDEFGEEKLQSILHVSALLSASETVNKMVRSVFDWIGTGTQGDDLTLVALKIK